MVRREDIKVKPGFEYDHYFPKAKLITVRKKKGATVEDTLLLIPAIVRETLFHTKRFANEVIKADTVEESCRRLWQFVFDHIAYKKDEDGKEQVRSPARTWHDRHNVDPETGEPMGVDCDCMSVFIASVLCNLNIDNVSFRIAKYPDEDKRSEEISWSHIYPIVFPNGKQITIDCVVTKFNYEEPYLKKRDTRMDLEYLNGVPVEDQNISSSESQDFMGLMGEQEAMTELGRLFKHRGQNSGKKKGRFKEFLKNGLHNFNKFNPATVALRNGVLASMKLNFLKLAEPLKYTYLSDAEAQKRGFQMDRFRKVRTVREKLEKIFYGAGGKIENLKKAILTGRGNRNNDVPVNGLGYAFPQHVDHLHEDMKLSHLLGKEIYDSENVDGMEGVNGLGELGEPVTAATIAAATTVLATFAALIKNIGNFLPKKNGDAKMDSNDSSGSGDDSSIENKPTTDTDNSSSTNTTSDNSTNNSSGNNAGNTNTNNVPATTKTETKNPPATTDDSTNGSDDSNDNQRSVDKTDDPLPKPTFWQNNKKWIMPVGIGAGSLGLLALIYHLVKPKAVAKVPVNGTPTKKRNNKKKNLLNGLKSKAKKGGNHQTKKRKPKAKKKVVTLL